MNKRIRKHFVNKNSRKLPLNIRIKKTNSETK